MGYLATTRPTECPVNRVSQLWPALPQSTGMHSPHRGCPLSIWPWWPEGDCVSGLHVSETIVETVLDHPQGIVQTAGRSTSSVLMCKRPIFLSWSFSLRGRLQAYHISRGYRGALREHGQEDNISALPWPH